ncbi:MFS transporter [Macrococcoides caseolyticum]|uniref:MFS transporter n=1 Tax=Macrococcoides caseolyticum TaxID=69966 RepID=UPI00105E0C95|nr:MFS transporter [Macrococcus caseolyticus]TDM28436.1 MFS transporter [Macrococcus caseolyticus]
MLKNKNIRNLYLGRLISSSGDNLYQVAIIWYLYNLTENTFYTGIGAALVMVPKILNFIFGPIIEQLNKSKVLKYSQFIQFLLMSIIPIMIFFDKENVFIILLIMFLISFIENFEGISEMSLVPIIVEKDNIGNFNSLASTSQEIVGIVMKLLFSLYVLKVGITNVYAFNAVTFLIASLFFSRIKTKEQKSKYKFVYSDYRDQLFEGIELFFKTPLFAISIPIIVANFSLGMTNTLLPQYSDMAGGKEYYGKIILAMTIGSIIGYALVGKILKYRLGALMIILPLVSFIFWSSSILVNDEIIKLILFSLAFIPFGMMNIVFITYIQIATDESIISRVASILDSLLVSAMPIGSLIAGFLPDLIGINISMFISCFGLVIISFGFLFNKNIRKLPSINS